MKGWMILAVILLCLWLIGRIRANIILIYDGQFTVRVKMLGITVRLLPKKKKIIHPDDFSPEKYRRLQAREEKKRIKREAKRNRKEAKRSAKKADSAVSPEKAKGTSKKKKGIDQILDLVYMLLDALKPLGKSFGRHFEVEAVKLKIKVGSEDAAKTAILYGILVQAVAYGLEILSSLINVHIRKKNREAICVNADFTAERITADLHLILKLRLWHVFAIGFSALGGIIRNRVAKFKKTAVRPDREAASDPEPSKS